MAVTTIAYFATGGLFTAIYSNAVRRFPVFRKPQLHVVCTTVGAAIGYQVHRYEEWARAETARVEQVHAAKSAEYMHKIGAE